MYEKQNKTTFISYDFSIQDFDLSNIERYELTSCLKSGKLDPIDYGFSQNAEEFSEWANDNFSHEDLYEIPAMKSLYYYPSYITFDEEERYKTASNITLFYDKKFDSWVVALTYDDPSLSSLLLDAFIKLGKGVPIQLAEKVDKSYNVPLSKWNHWNNCKILSQAFKEIAYKNIIKAESLI